ncbi:MAG: heme ABC exporter ATP-binding protein CcmA [Pseudomonadota bacterium]
MTLLQAERLTFQRGGEDIFEPVSLTLAAGRVIVIRGDNGAGKTTLLRVLAGVLSPSSGCVRLNAEPIFVGHLPAVKADLSGRENLHYERQLGASQTTIAMALIQVGLAGMGARPARTLSAGQKKRLGLARLLVRNAPIWLLDEPYASLDAAGCARVDALIDAHTSQGGAVVLSTHQQLPQLDAAIDYLNVASASAADG